MWRLIEAVQQLSLARTLDHVMAIVRTAARELSGADGATFVLRDGDRCHYADEDAIAPLWKGQKFPMSACISGWTMLHRQAAVIEDIYADPRIPVDAYRPTFVKSLVMVPIRSAAPVGAIGTYWATRHQPGATEVDTLQALANTTAVAIENVQMYAELERRVEDRTRQLEAANRELESFSYSVSHDLRAPIRHIASFTELLAQELGPTTPVAQRHLNRISVAARRMQTLTGDLLELATIVRKPMARETLDLSAIADDIIANLRAADADRQATVIVERDLRVAGDPGLMRVVIENLLSNAWKYTSRRAQAVIEVGSATQPDGSGAIFVRDNGTGFDMAYAGKLFAPFQRLHSEGEFEGSGVGLATVQRVVHRHGGRVWAEAAPDAGATFYFTLS